MGEYNSELIAWRHFHSRHEYPFMRYDLHTSTRVVNCSSNGFAKGLADNCGLDREVRAFLRLLIFIHLHD